MRRKHSRAMRPVDEVVSDWPDDLAFAALDLHNAGILDNGQIRHIEAWRTHLHDRGQTLTNATEEDWHTFGGHTRLCKLVAALALLDPDLTGAAQGPLRTKNAQKKGRSQDTQDGRGRWSRTRHLTLPEAEWPSRWRRVVTRMRERRERDDLDAATDEEGGYIYSEAAVTMTVKAIGQIAKICETHALPTTLNHELIDTWIGEMARRQLRAVSIATHLESVHRFGVELRSDPELLTRIRKKADAYTARAEKQRSRKEERYLHMEIGIGDVFEHARTLHNKANTAPKHAAATHRNRLEAALIALSVAAPLRCDDLHRLRIGTDICRHETGWSIDTEQHKTGQPYNVRNLMIEVDQILDDLVLNGRPASALSGRLYSRQNTPLFARDDNGKDPVKPWWPSYVWRKHFGTGVHMVRTMWGSYYLEHAPDQAWAASALLGHASEKSRSAYEVRAQRSLAIKKIQHVVGDIRATRP